MIANGDTSIAQNDANGAFSAERIAALITPACVIATR